MRGGANYEEKKMIKRKNLDPTLRSGLGQIPRETLHVCKPDAANADYLYNNIPRGHLFHTVLEAMAVAEDYFDVLVWPGEYTEIATIDITQDYLRLRAACLGNFHALEGTALWQYAGSEVPVITIDAAHGVEVAGFGRIIPYDSADGVGISIGETTECKGTWIHDNTFYAIEGSPGPTHIVMGASGVEAQYTLIENNWLYCGGDHTSATAGMIEWVHATRSTIRDNTFCVQGTSANIAGINVVDEAYIRGAICDNKFWGMEQSATETTSNAIKCAGALVGGDLMIDGNHNINFNANPFTDIGVEALGLNYLTELVIANG